MLTFLGTEKFNDLINKKDKMFGKRGVCVCVLTGYLETIRIMRLDRLEKVRDRGPQFFLKILVNRGPVHNSGFIIHRATE